MHVADPKTRPGTPADLPAVGRLHYRHLAWHAALDPDYSPPTAPALAQWHADRLGDRAQGLLVAEAGGRLLGFVTVRVEPTTAPSRWRWLPPDRSERLGTIGDLFVDDGCRRQGVGRALAESARDWLQRHGATRIELTVLADNPSGLAFWQAVGFLPHRAILRQELQGHLG